MDQYNFIAVVGEEERNGGYIDLRERDKQDRIGKFTANELLALFKSLEPEISQAEVNLWAKIKTANSTHQDEFETLEVVLKTQMFLEGTGVSLGAKDTETYLNHKKSHIDSVQFPNLAKWFTVLAKNTPEN